MVDVSGVKLEEVEVTADTARFSVVIDGRAIGTVTFVRYYVPAFEAIGLFVALWAGTTLCAIDRENRTVQCIERDDEIHRIEAFEDMWIVGGELSVDLFDPKSRTTLATYHHSEVITSCLLADRLVHVRDYYGATVTLDPYSSLQIVP